MKCEVCTEKYQAKISCIGELMPVDESEFNRIIGNLLKMPPKKHADSKLGTKKKTGKIIPPKRGVPVSKPDS
jgi:hypothetical protein